MGLMESLFDNSNNILGHGQILFFLSSAENLEEDAL
jgi:hypothetical protein